MKWFIRLFSFAMAFLALGCAHLKSQGSPYKSGQWGGYYQYDNGVQVPQSLNIEFVDGKLSGVGEDLEVGKFSITGTYSDSSGALQFKKTYSDASLEVVRYEGTLISGEISGIWVLTHATGQFALQPVK